MEQEYTFMLTSGRRVWVDEFHFERTYAGLMAGYPENESSYVTKQEKKAETMWGAGATFTVRPVTVIRKHGDRTYANWPHYCYKASLTSENIDPSDDGSRLIVIWFGEEPVGTSFLAMIENACRDVPWEKYAKGWNFLQTEFHESAGQQFVANRDHTDILQSTYVFVVKAGVDVESRLAIEDHISTRLL